jgi:hypothetical protein
MRRKDIFVYLTIVISLFIVFTTLLFTYYPSLEKFLDVSREKTLTLEKERLLEESFLSLKERFENSTFLENETYYYNYNCGHHSISKNKGWFKFQNGIMNYNYFSYKVYGADEVDWYNISFDGSEVILYSKDLNITEREDYSNFTKYIPYSVRNILNENFELWFYSQKYYELMRIENQQNCYILTYEYLLSPSDEVYDKICFNNNEIESYLSYSSDYRSICSESIYFVES